MTKKEITKKTLGFVKEKMGTNESTHDFYHAERVWKMAKYIASFEKDVDMLVVELGALLHDIADWKFYDADFKVGPKVASEWLKSLKVDQKIIDQVCHIIENISFKGEGEKNMMKLKEGKIVQDADRLDALGAIGIARTFAYGGFAKRPIYNSKTKPIKKASFKQYKNNNGTSINHFYEKLLLLKDRMNTKTAKRIALKRHKFLEKYLEEFYREWNAKI